MTLKSTDFNNKNNNLMTLFQKGDKISFEQLYDQFAPLLFSIISRLVENKKLAEQALSNAFVKIWQNRRLFSAHSGSIHSWLTRFAREAALSVSGKCASPAFGNVSLNNEDEISEKILELILVYGKTKQEVCQLLGIPSDTFTTALKSAIKSHSKH